jgi:hypothetical protein
VTRRLRGGLLAAWVGLAIGWGLQPAPGRGEAPAAGDRAAPRPREAEAANGSEHPLVPLLKWARQAKTSIEKDIQDYSATLVTRERNGNGQLGEYQAMSIKVRRKPFSIYLRFLSPESRKGEEAIYVKGRDDGKVVGHMAGMIGKLTGTQTVDPKSAIAMRGQRHPITEIGILRLCDGQIELAEKGMRDPKCEVKFFEGAKVNGRACTCIEVVHPVAGGEFPFCRARVFIDDQLNLPIRYEAYDWPKKAGAAGDLIEEFTYLDVKLNRGFTDLDFDSRNPSYGFPQPARP